MAAKKLKFLMMVSLVLCMVFVPITAQAGPAATGPTGTAYLWYGPSGTPGPGVFTWTVYPIFPPGYYGTTIARGTIRINKIVDGIEVYDRLISIMYNEGDTGAVTGSRPCGLAPGTYKAYLTATVSMYSPPSYYVTLPIASETFTITSSTSTVCDSLF